MSLFIPVVLVSGSLGCGKTTYLRSLVQANPGVRFGVVVNEFGEVGVDGDLLSPYVPDIVEIRNGCICCVTQDQLVPAIKEIIAKYAVDVLLIEMSGVADPTSVVQQVGLLRPVVNLKAHVVMGDCTLAPDEATRDRSYCNALARAGIIALSKSDIASDDQVVAWREFARSFNPRGVILDVQKAEAELGALLNAHAAETDAVFAGGHAAHGYASIYRAMGQMTERELWELSRWLGARVVRMKGIVLVDGIWREVQRVRERLAIAPYEGAAPAGGRLVFISNELAKTALQQLVDDGLDMIASGVRRPVRVGEASGLPR